MNQKVRTGEKRIYLQRMRQQSLWEWNGKKRNPNRVAPFLF